MTFKTRPIPRALEATNNSFRLRWLARSLNFNSLLGRGRGETRPKASSAIFHQEIRCNNSVTMTTEETQNLRINSEDGPNDNEDTRRNHSAKDKEIFLERVLGIPGASSMVAGIMVGSGIFVSARWVLVYSGSVGLALVIWLLCAVVSFIGGLCWVELGLTFPKSGGEYILIKETLGSVPAFTVIWIRILIGYPASSAIGQLTFASYVLEPFFPGCAMREDLVPALKLIAAWSMCTICLLNCLSAKGAARVQIVFTVVKILALVFLIVTGFVRLAQGHTSSFKDSFKDTTTQIGMVGLAFQSGLWAYEGWDSLNDVTEEVKNPVRNMPWSVLGSVVLVTCCYLLVNVGYLAVLTPQELKDSPATAVSVAHRMYGSVMARIVPIFVAASVFGSANGTFFSHGRVMFSAAREGHLPRFMAMIHTTKKTPIAAMLFRTILGCMLLIPDKSSVQSLISLFSTAEWLVYTLTVIGLLWTRYRRPDLPRPFKLPIFIPVVFLVISLYLTISPFIKAPLESFISLLLILAGIPVYFFFIYYNGTPKCVSVGLDWISFKTQQVLNVRFPTTLMEIGS